MLSSFKLCLMILRVINTYFFLDPRGGAGWGVGGGECPKLIIITDYLETYLTSFLCPSYRSKD